MDQALLWLQDSERRVTQLKVENPVVLRTIENFDLLLSPRATYGCGAMLSYPEALIKVDCKSRLSQSSADGDTKITRKKSAQHCATVKARDNSDADRGRDAPASSECGGAKAAVPARE
jgi:hypothetical protein